MARLTDELAAQHLIGDVCPVCEEAEATVIVELRWGVMDPQAFVRAVVCLRCADDLHDQFNYVTGGNDADTG